MRAYFFTNFYLSSLQNGIQVAHCAVDMSLKYVHSKAAIFDEWAESHKTIIVLNGGNSAMLAEKSSELAMFNDNVWGDFYEDKAALNSALTCVGVIVEERIYENAATLRRKSFEDRQVAYQALEFSQQDISLCEMIIPCGLAS